MHLTKVFCDNLLNKFPPTAFFNYLEKLVKIL